MSLPVDIARSLTAPFGTPHCPEWRDIIFIRYQNIAHHLGRHYQRIAQSSGYVEANRWLGRVDKQLKLGGTGLKLTDPPGRLVDYVGAKAAKNLRQIKETVDAIGKHHAPGIIRAIIERIGIAFPLGEEYTADDLIAALARVCDKNWLYGQLRKKQWRECEDFVRQIHGVHARGEIYVSDQSFCRRQAQNKQNQALLEKMEADNQEGQVYTLAELKDLSPSNPIIRRNELMVRMAGFESFAKNSDDDYIGVFYTLTCPSAFHPTLSTGEPNPKYNGSTVAEAQAHLNTVWQRTRAALKRLGINVFGFRVAEPHHDGTPHWHLLLFMLSEHATIATDTFERYALEMDGNEPGAKEHRFKAVAIDPDKGSATGYLAKYVAKNIDGEGVIMDHYGRDAITSALRIDAWKSINGIRQFQQIGGASVTVWRELRRLVSAGMDACLLRSLIQAADDADWETYNNLMGGVSCRLKDRPVRPMMIEREHTNRYGEAVKAIKGIWYCGHSIVTRPYEWIIKTITIAKSDDSEIESSDGVGFGAALSTAPPGVCGPLEFCQ